MPACPHCKRRTVHARNCQMAVKSPSTLEERFDWLLQEITSGARIGTTHVNAFIAGYRLALREADQLVRTHETILARQTKEG